MQKGIWHAGVRRWSAAVLLSWCLAERCHAGVLFTELFNYPDGALVAAAKPKWLTHSGTAGQADVLGGQLRLTQSESEDVHAVFASPPIPIDPPALVYAGFKVTFTALPGGSGTYLAHFKDAANGFRGRLFATTSGAAAGMFRLGVAAGANAPSASLARDLKLETPYLVVLRYEVNTASITFWVDPQAETDPGTTSSDKASPLAVAAFAFRQSLSSGNGMGSLRVDALTVATQFADLLAPPPDSRAPRILAAPAETVVRPGSEVTLRVEADGEGPLAYAWLFNGQPIEGATSDVLSLVNAGPGHVGEYQAAVSNPFGTTTSPAARLRVEEPAPIPAPLLTLTATLELDQAGDARTNRFVEQTLRPGERVRFEVLVTDAAEGAVQSSASGPQPGAENGAWAILEDVSGRRVLAADFVAEEAHAGRWLEWSVEARNSAGTNQATASVYVPTAAERGIVIMEFLANPATDAASALFNPLRRTTPSKNPGVEDEFVELANLGTAAVDLANWTLSDSTQTRHRFPAGTLLPAGGGLVVYGGPVAGASPGLTSPVQAANTGSGGLGLNNSGGDALILRNADGRLVSRVIYTRVAPQGSWTRPPDGAGAFVDHREAFATAASPGAKADGSAYATFNPPPEEPAAGLAVRIELKAGGRLGLTWIASPGRDYELLESESPAGPYRVRAHALRFDNAAGWCEVELEATAATTARFFRVSTR